MPLGKLAGNTAEDRGSDQVQMSTGPATHEPIQKTVIETGKKGRSEAAAGEKRMRGGFPYGTQGLLSVKGRTGQQRRRWDSIRGEGRSWVFVLSRSMRISVPFPYARISTASLSICSSVQPDLRLMIFKSCAVKSVNRAGLNGMVAWRRVSRKWRERRTVLVMPSVKRTNSILFPGPSQSGLRVRMRRRADACESAEEYERGMCRSAGMAPLRLPEEPMMRRGRERNVP